MSTLAVLPVKSFTDAKQRLEPRLEPAPRRMLAEAMFADVLIALRRTRAIARILVVSTDRAAQRVAGAYGATLLDEDDRGHNYAAARGVRHALDHEIERVLLVPGDCPLLDPAEVDQLVSREVPARSALIIPDRHGSGTNGLLLTPPNVIDPSFGPGSRARHEEESVAASIFHRALDVPSLALDIDTPEDLDELRGTLVSRHGGAAHTRGLLRRLRGGDA